MIKYFFSTAALLLMYQGSLAQVDLEGMRRSQQETENQFRGLMSYYIPISLKTRKVPKEKLKPGCIINLHDDTVACVLTIKGRKYFIEQDDRSTEVDAADVKAIAYLDLEEGNVVLYSLPFHLNGGVEGYFFKVSYKDSDFLLVRNEDKIVEELICMNTIDYLRGYYFLDLDSEQLTPVSRKNLFLRTNEFEMEIKEFLQEENNKLKKEWDFIEVLLYYKFLKYPGEN